MTATFVSTFWICTCRNTWSMKTCYLSISDRISQSYDGASVVSGCIVVWVLGSLKWIPRQYIYTAVLIDSTWVLKCFLHHKQVLKHCQRTLRLFSTRAIAGAVWSWPLTRSITRVIARSNGRCYTLKVGVASKISRALRARYNNGILLCEILDPPL